MSKDCSETSDRCNSVVIDLGTTNPFSAPCSVTMELGSKRGEGSEWWWVQLSNVVLGADHVLQIENEMNAMI